MRTSPKGSIFAKISLIKLGSDNIELKSVEFGNRSSYLMTNTVTSNIGRAYNSQNLEFIKITFQITFKFIVVCLKIIRLKANSFGTPLIIDDY